MSVRPTRKHLNAIFRAAHSIKGGAGTFGFSDMTELTHVLESLLDKLRKGELEVQSEMIDVFLKAGDVLKGQLAGHRGDGEADRRRRRGRGRNTETTRRGSQCSCQTRCGAGACSSGAAQPRKTCSALNFPAKASMRA